jgi:hypothetical protein
MSIFNIVFTNMIYFKYPTDISFVSPTYPRENNSLHVHDRPTNKASIGRVTALGLRHMAGLTPPSPSRFAGGVMSAIRPCRNTANVLSKPFSETLIT